MRGKPHRRPCSSFYWRNIPAYAGKTGCYGLWMTLASEHPRVCGENDFDLPTWRFPAGTSPRMRGKRVEGFTRISGVGNIPAYAGKTPPSGPIGGQARNIPAYAGKTFQSQRWPYHVKEHPRVCGENVAAARRRPSPAGTSPRMRGKPIERLKPPLGSRNIPAYAGKTRYFIMLGV